jgi:arginyl-tRNA synthetase
MQYKHFNAVANSKQNITALIEGALKKATDAGELPVADAPPAFVVEIPADTTNGDYATNVAMAGAKAYHMAPRQIAEVIVKNISLEGTAFEKVEIAGPGFINFFVKAGYFADIVRAVLEQGDDYGRTNVGGGKKYNVEFVSANPTGPMHLGNARGGVLGDTLAETLNWAGYNATREFLINDAGNQIAKFGKSLSVRYMQHFNGEENVPFPEDGYQGEDIKDLANEYIALNGDALLSRSEEERCDALIAFGLPKNVENMRTVLEKYRVRHDIWFSEQTLHDSGAVKETIELLTKRGYTYEKDDALWYKATEFGSEKDEVLVRGNGISTYFAADIAYHYNKFAVRGFDVAIDVWGADHHGHVARMKGAMDAIGLKGDNLDVVLMQLVRLVRGGEQVRMSKRTGKAITLLDLLEEVPVDAARFFFNMREPTSHMEFDMDLAVAQNSENPVYYVQYAHARICSIIKALQAEGINFVGANAVDYARLSDAAEVELARILSYFPGEIVAAAEGYDPARITHYVVELATQFHKFYTACHVRNEEDIPLMQSRLALCIATKTVLANALTILKISVPETM